MDGANKMGQAPAQQPSSTVTTLRAMVMLACLVAIPAFAFRVTDFPIREYAIQWLGGTVTESETRADLEEAPPFVPPLTSNDSSYASGGVAAEFSNPGGTQVDQIPSSFPQQPVPWSGSEGRGYPAAPGENVPPTMDRTVAGGPSPSPRTPGAVLANYNSPPETNRYGNGLGHLGYQDRSAAGANAGAYPSVQPRREVAPPPQAAQTTGGPDTVDQFSYIEQQLQALGADYYLLEKWGNQGECYRFHCRVAVGNSASFTKHFEATDSQPLGAMTKVLGEVESWRRGGVSSRGPTMSVETPGQSPAFGPTADATPHGPYARN